MSATSLLVAMVAQALTNLMRRHVPWQDGWTSSGQVVKKLKHPRQHPGTVAKVSITTGPCRMGQSITARRPTLWRGSDN
ncbi:MAG: hypothetical protein QNL33_18305 [Akkermansiaceae bacterium]